MDLSWLIGFLVLVVVLSIVYIIIKWLIMPVVPAPAQPVVWAILGVLLLIALLVYLSSLGGSIFHRPFFR